MKARRLIMTAWTVVTVVVAVAQTLQRLGVGAPKPKDAKPPRKTRKPKQIAREAVPPD